MLRIKVQKGFSKLWINAKKINFFHLLSANLLVQLVGFGGQIFLTRILPVEDIGRIKVLQSYLAILIIIATLGINVAVVKLCSEGKGKQYSEKLFIIGLKIGIGFSLIVTIGVFCMTYFSILSKDNLINGNLRYFILQLPFMVFNSIVTYYLQSQLKIKEVSKIQSYSKIFVLFISTLIAAIFGFFGYLVCLVITNSITSVLCIYFVRSELKSLFKIKIDFKFVKKILSIGSISFLTNLLGQLLIYLNIFIMTNFSVNNNELGFYSIAQLIVVSLMIIPNTINQILLPKFSGYTNDKKKAVELFQKAYKKLIICVIGITFLAYLLCPLVIPMVFGEQYQNSIIYLNILLAGFMFWGMYSLKGIFLFAIGAVKYNFYTNLISFLINIILNLILIRHFEVIGAAIATTSTYFLTIFINNYYYNKVIKSIL